MAYAVTQDAIDLYGEGYVLTSVTRDDTPDLDSFAAHLEKSSSEIDTYLGAHYSVPLVEAPSILVQYCVDIAVYRASSDAGTATDEKRQRYDDALAWLKLAARGTVILSVAATETAGVVYSAPARVFSRAKMDGL